MATAIRHGPTSLGGMNVMYLETIQAVEHTKLMVAHLRKEDEVGRLLQTSIDHFFKRQSTICKFKQERRGQSSTDPE
jgi:hypothetical protein